MSRFYKFYILLFVAIAAIVPAKAQVHSGVNLYTENLFFLNPSFASSGERLKATVQTGRLNSDQGGNLSISRFNVQGKLQDQIGVGVRVALLNQDEFNSLLADVASSYKIKLGENHSLQTGLAFGVYNNRANAQRFNLNSFANTEDPILSNGTSNTMELTLGAGFNYIFHNAQLSLSLPTMTTGTGGIFNQYHAVVSYRFDSLMQAPVNFRPMVTLAKLPYAPSYTEFNLQATWNNKAWIQPGIRSTGAFMTSLGIKLKELNVAYGFGIPYKKEGFFNRSMHEVMLSYELK